jgi:hypothetical protein
LQLRNQLDEKQLSVSIFGEDFRFAQLMVMMRQMISPSRSAAVDLARFERAFGGQWQTLENQRTLDFSFQSSAICPLCEQSLRPRPAAE